MAVYCRDVLGCKMHLPSNLNRPRDISQASENLLVVGDVHCTTLSAVYGYIPNTNLPGISIIIHHLAVGRENIQLKF